MLRDVSLANKLVMGSLLSAFALALVLLVSWLTGRANEQLLKQIEASAVPALELSLDLEEQLRQVPAQLEDAVVTFDAGGLEKADHRRDAFLARLRGGGENAAFGPSLSRILLKAYEVHPQNFGRCSAFAESGQRLFAHCHCSQS